MLLCIDCGRDDFLGGRDTPGSRGARCIKLCIVLLAVQALTSPHATAVAALSLKPRPHKYAYPRCFCKVPFLIQGCNCFLPSPHPAPHRACATEDWAKPSYASPPYASRPARPYTLLSQAFVFSGPILASEGKTPSSAQGVGGTPAFTWEVSACRSSLLSPCQHHQQALVMHPMHMGTCQVRGCGSIA